MSAATGRISIADLHKDFFDGHAARVAKKAAAANVIEIEKLNKKIQEREQAKNSRANPFPFIDHLPPHYQQNIFRLYNLKNKKSYQIPKPANESWPTIYENIKQYINNPLPRKPLPFNQWSDNFSIMREKRPDIYRKREQEQIRAIKEYDIASRVKELYSPVNEWLCEYIAGIKEFAPGTRYCAMEETVLKETANKFATLCASIIPDKSGTFTAMSIQIRALILGIQIDQEDLDYILETINIIDGVRHFDELPDNDPLNDLPIRDPKKRRLFCQYHWRRRLRKHAKRARQCWNALLRLSGGPNENSPAYCDNFSVGSYRQRILSSIAYTDDQTVVITYIDRKTGTEKTKKYSLTEIVIASNEAAVARLFGISKGMEQLTADMDYVSGMITITLPSCWHPNPSVGKNSWDTMFSPDRADKELQRIWSVFRSLMNNRGISPIGIKVIEFHKDGCPHLHFLFFCHWKDVSTIDAALQHARPEWNDDDFDALYAEEVKKANKKKKRRAKFTAIHVEYNSKNEVLAAYSKKDKSRRGTNIILNNGSSKMSSYIFKYIVKSLNVDPKDLKQLKEIDGIEKKELPELIASLENDNIDDHDSGDQMSNFERHRAAASERRIRRYALIGIHGCQRSMQTIYKLKEEDFKYNPIPADVRPVWEALHANDFATALMLMQAVKPFADPDTPRIRLVYEEKENSYGDMNKVPVGLQSIKNGAEHPEWTMPLRFYDVAVYSSKELKNMEKMANQEDLQDLEYAFERDIDGDITVVTTYPRQAQAPAQVLNSSTDLSSLNAHLSPDFMVEWEIERNSRPQNESSMQNVYTEPYFDAQGYIEWSKISKERAKQANLSLIYAKEMAMNDYVAGKITKEQAIRRVDEVINDNQKEARRCESWVRTRVEVAALP